MAIARMEAGVDVYGALGCPCLIYGTDALSWGSRRYGGLGSEQN
jgi:hypothetical protein